MKITCLILTYNEASRIHIAVSHALKWADEVVVVDKESTDKTKEIAEKMGATVRQIPFSKQGHEKYEDMAACSSNDWIWAFTPGEVPTRKVIEAGKAMVSDEVDLITVPMFYYSFGLHHPASPWAGGHQPRLYNRTRVKFTGLCHSPMQADKVKAIEYAADCFVLHQTHATAQDFIRSHADYMVNEAAFGTPTEARDRAIKMHGAFDGNFDSNPDLLPHMMAWKLYWLGVALHAHERLTPGVPEAYVTRAQQMMRVWQS